MFAPGWDPAFFRSAQAGVSVGRVTLDVRIESGGPLSCVATADYRTERGGTLFLLDPLLTISESRLDGDEKVPYSRTGPVVRLSDTAGTHRLTVRYGGALPSDGGLGTAGDSFDLNGNLLWCPTFSWGTRLELEVAVQPPRGATTILPSTATPQGNRATLRSAVDATVVGGRVRGSSRGETTEAISLVRADVRGLRETSERVVTWLEEKWGPRPFSPIRVVETWRKKQGAYARPGLIVTPDWSQSPEADVAQRMVHEATHEWWGMDVLPGKDWFEEDWLSEGLATYAEFLWLREGSDSLAARRFLKSAEERVDGLRGNLSTCSPFTSDGWTLSRFGGLLALEALERRVPDLLRELKDYRDRHRGGRVTTASLVENLSRFAPVEWLDELLRSNRNWSGDIAAPT